MSSVPAIRAANRLASGQAVSSEQASEQWSETAAALLDAAEALFSAQGYAAVGIRDIAEKAHANIASIKYHFGGKRDLYLATVRRTMMRREHGGPWAALDPTPKDPIEAAQAIVRFTRRFLVEALGDRPPQSCTMLMTREALQPSEALDDVVGEYVLPRQQLLERTIGVLRPDAAPTERAAMATSILAPILHYLVFRSFCQRVPNLKLNEPDAVDRIADAAAAFSLRGLGLPDEQIIAALVNTEAAEVETAA